MSDRPAPSAPPISHGLAAGLFAGVLLVWAALMGLSLQRAALPDSTGGLMLAVFRPGTSDADALAAMVRAGGEPVRSTWLGFAWVARGQEPGFVGRLKAEGALAAFGELPVGPTLGGCTATPVDRAAIAATRLQ
ncbi:hypothetical protein [Azospirillum picis]|uniref:SPOR domain-containing protein n=1 Tax=Azospirillum picis TaxID=488438 RepID=A0ABU0MJH5_9PROT|nr:hypothetical protein [Azospirillum picis]MBP2299459.1 hypothetical protein [Azospirillum picis]MDQ0533414.1 hypothetical protein [Azospirillum picis]